MAEPKKSLREHMMASIPTIVAATIIGITIFFFNLRDRVSQLEVDAPPEPPAPSPPPPPK